MHGEKPRVVGWGRFNLMCSAEEKMSKAILKDGMIRVGKKLSI
jgi:hypothetical protein